MCVTLVDIKGEKIKYKIGTGNENEYNINHLRDFDTLVDNGNTIYSLTPSSASGYDDNLKIKAEIFQKYISVLTSDKQKKMCRR